MEMSFYIGMKKEAGCGFAVGNLAAPAKDASA
jgi:hypothetical protein